MDRLGFRRPSVVAIISQPFLQGRSPNSIFFSQPFLWVVSVVKAFLINCSLNGSRYSICYASGPVAFLNRSPPCVAGKPPRRPVDNSPSPTIGGVVLTGLIQSFAHSLTSVQSTQTMDKAWISPARTRGDIYADTGGILNR